MMIEKELTPEDKADARRLKAIAERSGLTQEQIGAELGVTQGMIGHMLNGRRKIHIDASISFSKLFKVPVGEFSPSTQAKINSAYASPEGGNIAEILRYLEGVSNSDLLLILDIIKSVISRKSINPDRDDAA